MEKRTRRNVLSSFFVMVILLGAFLVVMTSTTAVAEQDGDYTNSTSGSPLVATVTGYTGTGGAISIPSSLGGYPVVAIGDYAFYLGTALTSVTIPNGVTSIGTGAFANCTSLASVSLGSGVTTIRAGAFYACPSLISITFLGLSAPTVGVDWVLGTAAGIRGHAYAASNFPAPPGVWHTLTMGAVVLVVPPGAPTNFTATAGSAQVLLAWCAPVSNGGSAITGYQVYLARVGGSQLLTDVGAATLSYVHTNGTVGTTYTYYVVASNAIGAGANSSQVSATPQAANADNTMLYVGIGIAVIAVIAIAVVLVRKKK